MHLYGDSYYDKTEVEDCIWRMSALKDNVATAEDAATIDEAMSIMYDMADAMQE